MSITVPLIVASLSRFGPSYFFVVEAPVFALLLLLVVAFPFPFPSLFPPLPSSENASNDPNLPIKESILASSPPDMGCGLPSSPMFPMSVQYHAPTLVKKPVLHRASFRSWRADAGWVGIMAATTMTVGSASCLPRRAKFLLVIFVVSVETASLFPGTTTAEEEWGTFVVVSPESEFEVLQETLFTDGDRILRIQKCDRRSDDVPSSPRLGVAVGGGGRRANADETPMVAAATVALGTSMAAATADVVVPKKGETNDVARRRTRGVVTRNLFFIL